MSEKGNPFDEPIRYLLAHDPEEVAEKAAVDFENDAFELPFLRWKIRVSHPDFSFELPDFLNTFTVKLLTLLYLSRADGVPRANHWVPYRELPDGLFYSKSFAETVESRLRDHFAADLPGLIEAGTSLGCTLVDQGDAGLMFSTYPRVSLLVTFWQADEEFPASTNILFDASACHYLNVFELKMLASEVVTRMIGIATGKLTV